MRLVNGFGPLDLLKFLDLTSVKELVDLSSNTLTNTLHLPRTFCKLITIGHPERKVLDRIRCVIISCSLVKVFLKTGEAVKGFSEFLVVGNKIVLVFVVRLWVIRGDGFRV